jgi:hypothetical protein
MDNSQSRRSPLRFLKELWQRLRRKPQPPSDPYADRLVPVRRGPKGRSGAAVAEPEEESFSSFRQRRSE